MGLSGEDPAGAAERVRAGAGKHVQVRGADPRRVVVMGGPQMDERRSHAGLHASMQAALAVHADAVPDEVSARLAQARANALALLDAAAPLAAVPPRTRGPSRWAPAFALAATLLLAFGVWERAAVAPLAALPPLPALEDPLEARAAQEIELLDELEFVAWMELQADADAAQGADAELFPGAAVDRVPGVASEGVRHAG